jgi:hypothetical protein
MFVRLLVLLISNVLCCFSVLVCCRSLVQIVVQKGVELSKDGTLASASAIERTWCDRMHEPQSIASHVSP